MRPVFLLSPAFCGGRLSLGQAVLLGSVASGKYVDILHPILGECLRYPVSFIGRGD